MGARWAEQGGCPGLRGQPVQRHGGVKEHGMF